MFLCHELIRFIKNDRLDFMHFQLFRLNQFEHLPVLERINPEQKHPQVIILAPSRELVMQIFQVIQEWKKGSDLRALSLIGGANVKKQVEKLKNKQACTPMFFPFPSGIRQ